jgi:hypothetical protein
MSWDFDDDNVPVPGHPLTAYLRIASRGSGCRVEIHQLTETTEQAAFMEAAWGMVLGRLKADTRRPRRPPHAPRPDDSDPSGPGP